VEGRIALLRSTLGPPPVAVTPPMPGPDASGWALVGAGGGALVSGGILVGLGADARSAVENAPDGARWADPRDEHERADPLLVAGSLALLAGTALATAGIVAVIDAGSRTPALAVRPAPSGIAIAGSF
jgi:hypothetical protein